MVFLQPSCWVPCTPLFFLILLGLMKRTLWVPLLLALRFLFGCAVLYGLVPACGFAVVRRSSQSFRGFGASLPVAWSQPTFVRYKAFTCCLQQFIVLRNLLLWWSGHPQDLSCSGPYHFQSTHLQSSRQRWRGSKAHVSFETGETRVQNRRLLSSSQRRRM
jgi:hypothetical protein